MVSKICTCGKEDWVPLPDSLASFCKGCGEVKIISLDQQKETKGKSLEEWIKDYDTKRR